MIEKTKCVVSVLEMASMVGLSRQRFYQLMGSAFPWPLYSTTTKRPFYSEEMQRICLEVRKQNCGVNGKSILFYSKGHRQPRKSQGKTKRPVQNKGYAEIINGLTALGLPSTKEDQVAAAIKKLYPNGITKHDHSEVLRAIFLHLKHQPVSNSCLIDGDVP